jgi:membrane-associated phospholipid phosphatase
VSSFSAFWSRRLARDDPRGLPLTFGLTISGLALILFLLLAARVERGDPDTLSKTSFDRRCAETMKEHAEAHPGLLTAMRLVTHLGGVPAMVTFSVVGAVLLWVRGYHLLAVGWVVAASGGGLIDLGTKMLIDRQRPPEYLRDEAVTETNESFPSGHSMGSIVGYGMLGYVVALLVRRRAQRVAAFTLLVVLVLLIGFSRIYLRAHWFTDVLGGFSIGTFWASLCITAVELTRRRARPAPRAT